MHPADQRIVGGPMTDSPDSPDEPRPDFCCDALRRFIAYWGPANVMTGFGAVRVLTQGDEYEPFKVCPFCGRHLMPEN